jgi:hypothetical protein
MPCLQDRDGCGCVNTQFNTRRQRLLFGTLASIGVILWLLVAPPRWWLNLTKPVDLSDPAKAGSIVVEKYGCRNCHRIEERGATFAPGLTGVTGRLDAVSIRLWLRDPRAIKGIPLCQTSTCLMGRSRQLSPT